MSQFAKKAISELLSREEIESILDRRIDVLKYPELGCFIPDRYLDISEVFSLCDIDEICGNFAPYTAEYEIEPFIEIYGNTVICIGFGKENLGCVYYFDFDFGCILLDKTLDSFMKKLVGK